MTDYEHWCSLRALCARRVWSFLPLWVEFGLCSKFFKGVTSDNSLYSTRLWTQREVCRNDPHTFLTTSPTTTHPLPPTCLPPLSHRGNKWSSCEGHAGFERRRRVGPQRSSRITGVITHCHYRSACCCSHTSPSLPRFIACSLCHPVSLHVYSKCIYSICTWHQRIYLYIIIDLQIRTRVLSPPLGLPGAQFTSFSTAATCNNNLDPRVGGEACERRSKHQCATMSACHYHIYPRTAAINKTCSYYLCFCERTDTSLCSYLRFILLKRLSLLLRVGRNTASMWTIFNLKMHVTVV